MSNQNDMWAIVELMGHIALAGKITKPGEYGGLWQIDVPEGDTFRTEFFGSQSVYRIRMVSEEIARAYAPRHEVIAYDAPIVTREEHEAAMNSAREIINELRTKLRALPEGKANPDIERWEDEGDQEDD